MAGGFAEIAVGVPVDTTFHYSVPAPLASAVVVGRRVQVPFGKRRAFGWVVDTPGALPVGGYRGELRPVLAALDDGPLLSAADLALYRWIAEYYRHPLGLVLKTALPAGLDRDRIKPKLERVFEPVEGQPGGTRSSAEIQRARMRSRAPAQGAVLDAVHSAGSITAAELRTLLGDGGASAASQLVRKGMLRVREVESRRAPDGAEGAGLIGHEPAGPPSLTGEQETAFARIQAGLGSGAFSPFLLHGVTGSGKTEVYLRAIARARDAGRSALVLVPEIALTPQLVGRFRARFGDGVAVLHSGLSEGQRFDEWRRIHRGEASIAVGARSAVFAPLSRLGIVVVDEEHDGWYKQDDGLRYHARDVAVVRAQRAGAVVVLGSATPSLETYQNALGGRYERLVLTRRVEDRPMPPVEVVSLAGGRRRGPLSPSLHAAIGETLAAKRQAILFLNRRGYAPSLACESCGDVHRCRDCAVAMTFHSPDLARRKKARQGDLFGEDPDFSEVDPGAVKGWLTCHYCGKREKPPSACRACAAADLRLLGIGTQRLERELGEQFPEARIARMDRDTTTARGAHGSILQRLAKGEIDILLGTQMIAKGLDFPGVTLVGVVLADTALNLADFRAAERTFQLLTQVSGRAGRGDAPGRVIIQTFHKDHYAVAAAARHDYEGFATRELEERRELFYPPFSRLVNLRIHGPEREVVERVAHSIRDALVSHPAADPALRVVGPAPAPLSMLRGRHRWQVLIRAASSGVARRLAMEAVGATATPPGVKVEIDVDPQSLL